jgi:uncharacterized protein YeeX (DUF496 family)
MRLRNKGIQINFDGKCLNEDLIDIFENFITRSISFSDIKSCISNMRVDNENYLSICVVHDI